MNKRECQEVSFFRKRQKRRSSPRPLALCSSLNKAIVLLNGTRPSFFACFTGNDGNRKQVKPLYESSPL